MSCNSTWWPGDCWIDFEVGCVVCVKLRFRAEWTRAGWTSNHTLARALWVPRVLMRVQVRLQMCFGRISALISYRYMSLTVGNPPHPPPLLHPSPRQFICLIIMFAFPHVIWIWRGTPGSREPLRLGLSKNFRDSWNLAVRLNFH